jgi:hypothetical protein
VRIAVAGAGCLAVAALVTAAVQQNWICVREGIETGKNRRNNRLALDSGDDLKTLELVLRATALNRCAIVRRGRRLRRGLGNQFIDRR